MRQNELGCAWRATRIAARTTEGWVTATTRAGPSVSDRIQSPMRASRSATDSPPGGAAVTSVSQRWMSAASMSSSKAPRHDRLQVAKPRLDRGAQAEPLRRLPDPKLRTAYRDVSPEWPADLRQLPHAKGTQRLIGGEPPGRCGVGHRHATPTSAGRHHSTSGHTAAARRGPPPASKPTPQTPGRWLTR